MPWSIVGAAVLDAAIPAVVGSVVSGFASDVFGPSSSGGNSPAGKVAGAVAGGAVANYLSPADAAKAASAADPFASQRGGYQKQLSDMISPGGAGFTPSDPSYAFRQSEGIKALNLGAAAGGFLNSGNRLVELEKYGQGLASSEYQAQYSRLSTLAGVSAGAPGTAGQILAQQNSQNQQSAGAVGSSIGGIIGSAVTKIGGRFFDKLGNEVNSSTPGFQGDPAFTGSDGYGGDNYDFQTGGQGRADSVVGPSFSQDYGSFFDSFQQYAA